MYLKRILHELASFPSSDDKLKVASSHPRFDELVAKYPDVQVRVRFVRSFLTQKSMSAEAAE